MAETAQEPLRDRIARAIYEDPRQGPSVWYELSEDRREYWRADADRVLVVLQDACPGHVASERDKKLCDYCDTHINSLR